MRKLVNSLPKRLLIVRLTFIAVLVLGIAIIGTLGNIVEGNGWDFIDECDILATHWSFDRGGTINTENSFIADGLSSVGEQIVPYGQYCFFSKTNYSNFVRIRKDFGESLEDFWEIEISLKICSLPTLQEGAYKRAGWRGFCIEICNGTTRYIIGLTNGLIGCVGSKERYLLVSSDIIGETDTQFHAWKFSLDEIEGNLTVYKDNVEVGSFTSVVGEAVQESIPDVLSYVRLSAPALDTIASSSDANVYVDRIALRGLDCTPFLPTEKALVYPNPFIEDIRISYALDVPSKVRLVIYNEAGIIVYSREEIVDTLGYNEFDWNGKDMNGIEVATGIYSCFVSIKGDDDNISQFSRSAIKVR